MKRILLICFVLMSSLLSEALAQRTVSGKVTTPTDNEGIPGVTVRVKGTSTGVNTDFNGNYRISVPEAGGVLVFSFVGFETLEQQIGNRSVIDVVLKEDVQQLQEVIVTGYTERSRMALTSSVSEVGSKDIENVPLPDVNQMLQGKAAGVLSTVGSGQPGAATDIRIRGIGSLNASSSPLYVVDGVIVSSGDLTRNTPTNDILANINPNDIESINVLKDASATALYGSRAANGVILINTKRGKAGKTKFTARSQYGTTNRTNRNFDVLSSDQMANYNRTILRNSGYDQDFIDDYAHSAPGIEDYEFDWLDASFRTGTTQNHELSASGGDQKTKFFISGSFFDQEGILINSNFTRYSGRVNLDHHVNDKLSLGLNLNTSYTDQLSASPGNQFNSPLLSGMIAPPYQNPINPATGEYYVGPEADFIMYTNNNYLRNTPLNPRVNNNFRTLGNFSARYQFIPELALRTKVGLDYVNIKENSYTDPTTPDGIATQGRAIYISTDQMTVTSQVLLDFNKQFGSHKLSGIAGYEFQNNRYESFDATGTGFADGFLKTLQSAAVPESIGGYNTEYTFISLLSQLNYDISDKYFLSGSLRRDGSSRFGANNRWANFWSLGGAWAFTNEEFMSGLPVLSLGKLRASYGTAGNANIDNFQALGLYGFSGAYGGIPGSTPSQLANPDLTWEQNVNYNVAADLGFFKNRVNVTAEYYNRETQGLLLETPISSTSGFLDITRNVGSIRNHGWEFVLNTVNLQGDFTWTTDFNIAFNRNEILSLYNDQAIAPNSQQRNEVGHPVRSFYLRDYAGADPETGKPRWRTDEGFTSVYAEAPRYFMGDPNPDFFGGLTNNLSYKGFGLSFFLYFNKGGMIYNDTDRILDSDGAFFGMNQVARTIEDRWEQPGDIAFRPQARVGGNSNANSASSRYLMDASYIRLRNVTLSYNLPSTLLTPARLSNVRVYAQGQNLWTLTDPGYTGFDPEAAVNGTEFFRYPVGRSVTFGVEIGF